jgi:hypothetical protein
VQDRQSGDCASYLVSIRKPPFYYLQVLGQSVFGGNSGPIPSQISSI